jgi:hypothetical protein
MIAVNVFISLSYSFAGSYQIITIQMYCIIYNICKLGQTAIAIIYAHRQSVNLQLADYRFAERILKSI